MLVEQGGNITLTPFLEIYVQALIPIMAMMTVLWVVSVFVRNAGIVDPFWGFGFVIVAVFYFIQAEGNPVRQNLILALAVIWGLRLFFYLAWRNYGKGEDFRYREFRENFGPDRYWWFSFFQVFLLQGVLMWLISAPLLGAQYRDVPLNLLDAAGVLAWLVGFVFEAGGDWQLARFKRDPANKGKLLTSGFWRCTRHPNYFGDSAVWWGYGLICLAAGSYIPVLGSILMTAMIIKVSGVELLEKTMKTAKPGYEEYARRTSSFFPWFPKS